MTLATYSFVRRAAPPDQPARAVRHRRPRPDRVSLGRDARGDEADRGGKSSRSGPTGAGDSPYQSFSAFAGSINAAQSGIARTRRACLLRPSGPGKQFPDDHVDYARVNAVQGGTAPRGVGRTSAAGKAPSPARASSPHYREREAAWLDDYALFIAIRDSLGGRALPDWPPDLLAPRTRRAGGGREGTARPTIGLHKFGQFLFDRQWLALKQFANERGVKIIGDAPIFVALDSADVWAHPDQFLLDAGPQADGRRGRAARLLQRRRAALGQPDLRLGANGSRPASRGGWRG